MRCCHRAEGSAASEEPPPAGLSQFRGRGHAHAPPQPPRRPPAPTRIYPKRIDPDTFCRSPMPPASWKTSTNGDWPETSPSDDSFRNPWRICSPDAPHTRMGHGVPLRAASRCRSRKRPQPTAPKVPSTSATSFDDRRAFQPTDRGRPRSYPRRRPRSRAPPQRRSSLCWLGRSDTFSTTANPVLTRSERRWLSRA